MNPQERSPNQLKIDVAIPSLDAMDGLLPILNTIRQKANGWLLSVEVRIDSSTAPTSISPADQAVLDSVSAQTQDVLKQATQIEAQTQPPKS